MIDPNRAGLWLGSLASGCDVVWATLVATGWAQPILDAWCRLHLVHPGWTIAPFDPGTAALLVLSSGAAGYFAGLGGATLWNRLAR